MSTQVLLWTKQLSSAHKPLTQEESVAGSIMRVLYFPNSMLSDVNTTRNVVDQAFILSIQTLETTWVYSPSNSPAWKGRLLKFIQIAFK